MANGKQRLQQRGQAAPSGVGFYVNPPVVRMKAPTINIPEITLPPLELPPVDTGPIAEVVGQLNTAIQALAEQQNAILGAIKELAGKQVKVSMPKRPAPPGSFRVELDKRNGETVGMSIYPED